MTFEYPTAGSSKVDETNSGERTLVSARAVIRDHGKRVLAVRHTPERCRAGQERWYLPGGLVHKGELPSAAAAREVREELGLGLHVGQLLMAAWSKRRYPQTPPRLQLLFDFGSHCSEDLSRRIVLQTEEICDFAWFDRDGVNRLLYPAQAEQLDAIAMNRIYLEQDPIPRTGNRW